jgi:hypothetical protein
MYKIRDTNKERQREFHNNHSIKLVSERYSRNLKIYYLLATFTTVFRESWGEGGGGPEQQIQQQQ